MPAGVASLATPLAGILLLAFILRLAVVLWLSDTVPSSDGLYYQMAAEKIAHDWRFPFDRSQVEYFGKFGWWPPGYPFFLAALYSIFGVQHRLAVFVQVLLGTLVVWLVHGIGKRAAGETVGRIAALLVALDPTYIFLTNILASENLYVVWLALGLWLATRPGRGAGAPALAGVVLGLGALTRAVGLGVPVIVAAWRRGRAPGRRAWLVTAAWLVGGSAIAIAPWTLRNAAVAGSPALVCFGGGLNFYFGHNEVSVGYRDLSTTPLANLTTLADIDRAGYRLGLRYVAQHPFGVLRRGGRKIGALFAPPGYAPHSNSAILLPENWRTDPEQGRIAAELRARQRAKNVYLDGIFTFLASLHTYLVLAGAVATCVFLWRRLPGEMRLCAYLSLYWIAAHAFFWAQPRFRAPMEIFLALLAAYGLAAWMRGRRGAARRGSMRTGLGLATLFFALLGCTPAPPLELPPVEAWGDLRYPCRDSLEAAAAEAIGPRPLGSAHRRDSAPVRLAEFLLLDASERDMREHAAASILGQAEIVRRLNGVDSLPAYLEALRVDPAFTPAFEGAVRLLAARGADARARALAVQGLRLEPRSPRLWALLGGIYMRSGKDAPARQALERALALDTHTVTNARLLLAMLYVQNGQTPRADSLVKESRAEVPAWLRLYLDAAQARRRGDPEKARQLLEEACRDPQAPVMVHVEHGALEFELGHLVAAASAYETALRLSPGEPAALGGIGIVQRARGDLDAAVASLARVARACPRDSVAQFNLAAVSLEAAPRARAAARADSLYSISEQAFSACIAAGFRGAEAREQRAYLRLRRRDALGAAEDARALLEQPEHAPAGRLLLARAAVLGNSPQEAVAVLAPDFERDALSTEALDLLGMAYLHLDRAHDAARVLRRAHERQPEDWRTAMNFSVALSRSGELAEAESILRVLAAERPRDADVLQNLAAVLQRRGRRAEAEDLLHRARAARTP